MRITRALRRGKEPDPASGVEDVHRRELDLLLPADRAIVEVALQRTMTSVPRLGALVDAVRYIERRGVKGAFAECGVWRGGSVLGMILTLQELDAAPRDIYLYDTFEGMTEPTDEDTSPHHAPATELWKQSGGQPWPELFNQETFNEDDVRQALLATGYPEERLHFVRGRIEDTIPDEAPDRLALLRLDTDWYESTRHELEHLYPRLVEHGVLIVDDYGHWEGCRRAVDEYFGRSEAPILLSRIDYAGRIGIKA
jgi:O-methyltransferase